MTAPREVKMKLTVDAGDVTKASAAMAELAKNTREAGAAVAARGGGGGGPGRGGGGGGRGGRGGAQFGGAAYNAPKTAWDLAEERVARARQRQDVEAISRILAPELFPQKKPADSGGGFGFFGLGSGLGRILGLAGINAAVGGADAFFANQALTGINANGTRALFEGGSRVPLVGHLFSAQNRLWNGYADERSQALISGQQRLGNQIRQEMGARLDAAQQVAGVNMSASDASIDAAAARRFSNSIAGRGRGFVTEERLGISTANTGTVYAAYGEAQSNLEAARQREAVGRKELEAQRTKYREAENRRLESQARAGQLGYEASRTQYVVDNDWIVGVGKRGANRKAQEAYSMANERAQADALRADKERQQLAKQIADQEERAKNVAQAKLMLDQRSIDLAKDKLQIGMRLEEVLKGGAEQIGFSRKGDVRRLERVSAKFAAGGIEALSQRELEIAQNYGPAQDALRRAARERAIANPALDRINVGFGISQSLPQLTEENKKLAGEIIEANARINADFKESIASIQTKNAKDLVGVILEQQRAQIDAIRAEFRLQEQNRRNGANG